MARLDTDKDVEFRKGEQYPNMLVSMMSRMKAAMNIFCLIARARVAKAKMLGWLL